jgi:CheY-like chemotaxis protein
LTTILVIDDEAVIRLLCRMALEKTGYQVAEAAGGAQAARACAWRPPDLVLCDLALGAEDGRAVILELRRQHPAIKVVAMSGAFLDGDRLDGAAGVRTLSKPFGAADLLQAVHGALQGER